MTTPPLTEALRETLSFFEETGTPLTTTEVAERLDIGRRSTYERLARLVEHGRLETKTVGANGRVWWRSKETDRGNRSVTERDRERQLRSFREAAESASHPVYLTDREGTIEYVNPRFEETTGYTAEEAIGETPQLLRPGTDDRDGSETWGDAKSSGNVRREEFTITEDGDRYVVEETVVPVRDDSGEIEGFVGKLTDPSDSGEDDIERKRQREQLAALSRINAVVRDITESIVEQPTREEIERTVCECLADVGCYEFAWIGEIDMGSRTVRQRTEAGVEGYLDDVVISVDPEDERSKGDAGRALRTGEVQTTTDVRADDRSNPWRDHIRKYDFRSAAAIPIIHENTTYGVLKVYAERPAAFEGPDRAILGQLGGIIGHAIAAVERKQALMSDEVVTLGFHIPNMLDSWGVESAAEGQISFDDIVATSDEAYLVYGTMTPDARETFEAMAEQYDYWRSVRVLSEGDERISFQIRSSKSSLRARIASEGGAVERTVLDEGDLDLRVRIPPTVDVSSITEIVLEEYPNAQFLSKRQFTRPRISGVESQGSLPEDLTDRQRAVLEAAYYEGYFEWPRETSGEELADSLGIAPPTLSQHLRKAEQRVFDSIMSSHLDD